MAAHEYVPRADGFRTDAVLETGERKSGIPCAECAQFEWNHEKPKAEKKVEKPKVTDAGKRTTSKPATTKPAAKKSTTRAKSK